MEVDLSALLTVEGDVTIEFNSLLSDCDAQALVENVSIGGSTSIFGNAPVPPALTSPAGGAV